MIVWSFSLRFVCGGDDARVRIKGATVRHLISNGGMYGGEDGWLVAVHLVRGLCLALLHAAWTHVVQSATCRRPAHAINFCGFIHFDSCAWILACHLSHATFSCRAVTCMRAAASVHEHVLLRYSCVRCKGLFLCGALLDCPVVVSPRDTLRALVLIS